MAELNTTAPSLPLPPNEYNKRYFDQFNNILRLYFNQLSNPGDMGGATLNLNLDTLPTEADFANLRLGDIYRDTQDVTQAGSQMLRIKTSTKGPIALLGVKGSGAVGTVGPVGGTITLSLTGVTSTGAVGTVTP